MEHGWADDEETHPTGLDARPVPLDIHHMMNMGVEPAIAVRGLTVDRGERRVLDGLSFDIATGMVTGLLGPSGCGKTTLMRAVVGVQVVAGGDVRVLGEPAGSPALRSRIGYVTQAPSVYADLTVTENLRYFAAVLGVPPDDVQRVVTQVGLDDHADVLTNQLSGGQTARVSLAAALLGHPDLLVLDEPTVGLDPVLRRDLWQLFADLAATGVSLLISSHVMDEATRCQRLLLMRDGRLIADDTPPALLERTATHDIEAAFLALVERDERRGTTQEVGS
jgi:ABC-2 type transport system ATP-binding protein